MKCRNVYFLYITMDVEDNRKRCAAQIKRLAAYKAVPVNSYSDEYVRFPHKKTVRIGVLPSRKQHGEKRR